MDWKKLTTVNKRTLKHIVVEGPIGVGKTALAKRLASTFNTDLLLENALDNPFLEKFYEDPKNGALPAQLHFLFQRLQLMESLRQSDMFKPAQVVDFLIQKDRVFAEVTLSDSEFELYNQVYQRLILDPPVPDLVIYLQASVEVLLERIAERGITYEKLIDERYLGKVADAYIRFFYHYNDSPILIVNTTELRLHESETDYEYLLNYINNLTPGKHYLNPQSL